jgi:hypothetical protein
VNERLVDAVLRDLRRRELLSPQGGGRQVVGMRERHDRRLEQRALRAADQVAERRVHLEELAVEADERHRDRALLEHAAEARLALLEPGFVVVARRRVLGVHDHVGVVRGELLELDAEQRVKLFLGGDRCRGVPFDETNRPILDPPPDVHRSGDRVEDLVRAAALAGKGRERHCVAVREGTNVERRSPSNWRASTLPVSADARAFRRSGLSATAPTGLVPPRRCRSS